MFWISVRTSNVAGFSNSPRDKSLYLSFDGSRDPTPADRVPRPGDWVKQVMNHAETTKTADGRKNIVFFVHGFNNSVENVREAHTRLETGLTAAGLPCTVVSFDWPSGQIPLAYLPDLADAKTTAFRLVSDGIRLFDRSSRPNCDITIHVVAHSMGAFVVQYAFEHAEFGSLAGSNWSVAQVAFLAADAASASLAGTSDRSTGLYAHSNRLTNYFSGHDEVLQISNVKRFGTEPRAGRVGLPTNAPSSALDVDCTRHYEAIAGGLPPVFFPDHCWYFYDPGLMRDLAMTLDGRKDRYAIPGRTRIGENDFELA